MELINDCSKKVAKARQLILEFLDTNNDDLYNPGKLEEAEKLLEQALDKLTLKM